MYTISPSWEQAFKWATLRPDYALAVAIGIIALAFFVIILVGIYSGAKWLPKAFENNFLFGWVSLGLLGLALACFLSTPLNIKQNNNRLVPKEIKDNPAAYWDSLAAGHHIVDGPY